MTTWKQAWRTQLQTALGGGASVLAELVPELTQLLGPQAPATPLDPVRAQAADPVAGPDSEIRETLAPFYGKSMPDCLTTVTIVISNSNTCKSSTDGTCPAWLG